MRRGGVEEMQERTVASEIEVRGKDVFGLFAGLRCVRYTLPIPQHPRQMGGLQTTPDGVEHGAQVTAYERSGIEPQTWEDLAAVQPFSIQRQTLILPGAQHEPIDLLIQHAPDDVFTYPIAAIDAELGVQVIACRA